MPAGIEPMFLRVHPRDIAMVKFLFESYEEIAIVRTLDRREAVIVVLAMSDFADVVRDIIGTLVQELACEVVPPPPEATGDWLLAALA
jgi:hypothetical protein